MPLETPSPSNGYSITGFHKMSVDLWQAVLTSLHGRLSGLEAVAGSFEDALSDTAIALAQGRIDDSIVPQLTQVQQQMAGIQSAIAVAEDQLAALQNGGVKAENVPLAGASPLFPLGTDAQEAFTLIEQAVFALAEAKLDASTYSDAKATGTEAAAGQSNSKWLTPNTGAAMIGALAGDVVKQVFTASGTFTKEADDIAYFVEAIGAGGGGAKGGSYQGGGQQGEWVERFIIAADISSSVSVTVGAAGSGTATNNASGTAGGASSFGAYLVSRGGKGGLYSASSVMAMLPWELGGAYAAQTSIFPTTLIVNPSDPFSINSGYTSRGLGVAMFNQAGNVGPVTVDGPTFGEFVNSSGPFASGVANSRRFGKGGARATDGSAPGGGGGAALTADAKAGNGARGEVIVYRFKRRKAA